MKISTKTRYAMRFMIDLAEHWNQGPQPLREVAHRQGISKKYMEQIVPKLNANGLITVYRGHLGGYELSRAPEEISMADVMSATEGGLNLLDCLASDCACARADSCQSIRGWKGLQDAMVSYLSSCSLKDLADE